MSTKLVRKIGLNSIHSLIKNVDLSKRLEKQIFTTSVEKDISYTEIIYDYIGVLHKTSFKSRRKSNVIKDITNGLTGFDMSIFSDLLKILQDSLDQDIDIINIEEGDMECKSKKCGSKRCFIIQAQTRSGDEGMSTWIKCSKCPSKYRVS